MNVRRLCLVAQNELRQNFRRPMIWVLIGLLGFFAWTMATGSSTIQASGDSSVGGKEQWLTGEFTVAQILTALMMMLYSFFVTIGAGMTIIRDDEVKINDILQGTPLTPGEYVWGKFPHNSPLLGSISSDRSPRWFRESSMRANMSLASSIRPKPTRTSMYQKVQMVNAFCGSP